jgi:GWxTD domain-containing protein
MRASLMLAIIVSLLSGVPAAPVFSQQETTATGADAGIVETDPLEWDEGPAGFLLTKDDKKDWKQVTTREQAQEFIELFWARRNPDPSVSFNPVRAQFVERVRYADENFSSRGDRGSLSDRGKVLILLGPPHQSQTGTPAQFTSSSDTQAGVRAELWLYDPARLPEALKVSGSRLMFVFVEEGIDTNRFILDRSNQEASMGARTLARAPEAYVLHPDLQEVPKPVSVPGGEAATATQLAWLEQPTLPWSEQSHALTAAGVADAASRPLWFHLELPQDAPRLDVLAGTVSDADGEVLSTFQVAAEPIASQTGTAYHLVFPLSQGSYRLAVVGAAGNQPQVAHSSGVEVPAAQAEGTWMSDLWVAVDTEMKDDALLGSPFCFGRMHIVPLRSGATVKRESELTYLGFIVRPGQSESGDTRVKARVVLKKDGARLGKPLEMPLQVIQLYDDLYVFVNAINIAALPEPGDYSLEFSIRDSVSDVVVERDIDLTVAE